MALTRDYRNCHVATKHSIEYFDTKRNQFNAILFEEDLWNQYFISWYFNALYNTGTEFYSR